MMQKITISVLILSVILILTSCGKYEEGPTISFRSRQKRIEGLWKVEKFMVAGIDSTSFYKTMFGSKIDITDGIWEMHESGGTMRMGGNWNWHTLKYYTMFNVDYAYVNNEFYNDSLFVGIGPFITQSEIKWEILRISNKELFLTTQLFNMMYRIELSLEEDH
ncbi:MAG: hypothetical protein ABIJ97_14680 [Bacteroidota bacterium]